MKTFFFVLALVCVSVAAHSQSAEDSIMVNAATMPVFSDDPKAFTLFIMDNIHYPKEARRKRIDGKVNVEFIVQPNGSVTVVRVIPGVKKAHPLLEEEALRVCRMLPPFKYPGTMNGEPVPTRMCVPILFKLPE